MKRSHNRVQPRPCRHCGKVFKIAGQHDRKFCSWDCFQAEIRPADRLRTCDRCGKQFLEKKQEVVKDRRYCSNVCKWGDSRADGRPGWKGGQYLSSRGYIEVYQPDRTHKKEHRIVMEAHIGRPLRSDEHVHHKNGIRTDNRLENLQLMTRLEHLRHHAAERRGEPRPLKHRRTARPLGQWSDQEVACLECGATEKPHLARGLCRACYLRLRRRNELEKYPTTLLLTS